MKIFLIFGSEGNLGKGITRSLETLLEKDDIIYLFDRNFNEAANSSENKIIKISIDNLQIEDNVINALKMVDFNRLSNYFLISTIGGFSGGKTILESGPEELERLVNINMKISFLITKHFSKYLIENKLNGSILLTSATASLFPEKGKAFYGATKGALNSMIKSWSLELWDNGITINAVAPYILDTKENREWVDDKTKLVSSEKIGKFIVSVFDNFHILTGNIFELWGTVNLT